MLLKDNIQIAFKNIAASTIKAGQAVILGQRTQYKAVLGVAVADVEPGESGLIETSGVFSFDESDVKTAGIYQQVYAYNTAGINNVKFSLTQQDGYIYAGISLTNRSTNGGPLVLALGYNSPVYKAAAGASTSAPSGDEAGAMSDSSATVDPSSSSEPGAM